MLRAFDADTSNPDIADLAEATVLKEVLVSSALWRSEGVAGQGVGVVDLIKSTLKTLDGGGVNCHDYTIEPGCVYECYY